VWTPGFQAPGWEGKVSAWSDWYALGVSIHKLLVRTSVHVCFEMGLLVVSAAFGLVRLSGWRCCVLNEHAGGAPGSSLQR
jgi:hypothetical protein